MPVKFSLVVVITILLTPRCGKKLEIIGFCAWALLTILVCSSRYVTKQDLVSMTEQHNSIRSPQLHVVSFRGTSTDGHESMMIRVTDCENVRDFAYQCELLSSVTSP